MPVLKKDRAAFMAALAKLNPDPKSELNYTTPFELLIAVMLSAQATDKGVNLATAKLFPVANTPEKILALGLENLTAYVNTINLYRTKAAHIMEACRILVDQYGGEVPRTMKELVALPGVGRKTANVVLNVAFHEPTIAVDTHIFRVCNPDRGGGKASQDRPGRIQAQRPPLASPLRALPLQGEKPRVHEVPGGEFLQCARKESGARGRSRGGRGPRSRNAA